MTCTIAMWDSTAAISGNNDGVDIGGSAGFERIGGTVSLHNIDMRQMRGS